MEFDVLSRDLENNYSLNVRVSVVQQVKLLQVKTSMLIILFILLAIEQKDKNIWLFYFHFDHF